MIRANCVVNGELIGADNGPEEYEAYVYEYEILECPLYPETVGMGYIGYHKGDVEDSYTHSSTDEKFNEIFAHPETRMRASVLRYGTVNECMEYESFLLRERGIFPDNSSSFNKTYGAVKPDTVREDVVENLVKRTEAGEFIVHGKWEAEYFVGMPRLQVRKQDDSAHIKEISNRIKDAASTANCDPPVVLADKVRVGNDFFDELHGGNHTVQGAAKSGFPTFYKHSRIPKDVWSELTEAEIHLFGLALNPKDEKPKKGSKIDDGVEFILENYERNPNNNWWNTAIRAALMKLINYTADDMKRIKKKCNDIILTKEEEIRTGKVWANYSTPRHKKVAAKFVKDLKKEYPNSFVLDPLSSSALGLDKIFDKWEKFMEFDEEKECYVAKCDVHVPVYFPSFPSVDTWNKKSYPSLTKKFDIFRTTKYGATVHFHPMETLLSNKV